MGIMDTIKTINTISRTGKANGWMYFIRNRQGLKRKTDKAGFDRYLKQLAAYLLAGYGVQSEKGIFTFQKDEGRVFMIHTLPQDFEAATSCDMSEWGDE